MYLRKVLENCLLFIEESKLWTLNYIDIYYGYANMSGEGVKVIQAYNDLNAASSRGMLLLLFVDTKKGFVCINFDYRP